MPSRFFTMDVALRTNGECIIVELGDGQVSGLPDQARMPPSSTGGSPCVYPVCTLRLIGAMR